MPTRLVPLAFLAILNQYGCAAAAARGENHPELKWAEVDTQRISGEVVLSVPEGDRLVRFTTPMGIIGLACQDLLSALTSCSSRGVSNTPFISWLKENCTGTDPVDVPAAHDSWDSYRYEGCMLLIQGRGYVRLSGRDQAETRLFWAREGGDNLSRLERLSSERTSPQWILQTELGVRLCSYDRRIWACMQHHAPLECARLRGVKF